MVATIRRKEYIPPSEKFELVRRFQNEGLSVRQIAERTGLSYGEIGNVVHTQKTALKAANIAESVKEKLFEEKVPVLEAIADRSLIGLLEWVDSFMRCGLHKKMDVTDANKLTNIVERLHTMFRLELGKSTSNVAVAITDSKLSMERVLRELKKPAAEGGDPFIEYPALPEHTGTELDLSQQSPEKVEVQCQEEPSPQLSISK